MVGSDALAKPSYSAEQYQALKSQICDEATNAEFETFLALANRMGLDAFARQIVMIQKKKNYKDDRGRWLEKKTYSPMVTIDGLRLIAQRTGEYEGQTPVEWCDDNGQWTDVWLNREPPFAARVGVYRTGFRAPMMSVARFDSYAVIYDGKPSGNWDKMPELMIGKVAESLSLRRAFPQELSGAYSPEEMDQATVSISERTEDPTNGHYAASVAQLAESSAIAEEQARERLVDDDWVLNAVETLKSFTTKEQLFTWAQLNCETFENLSKNPKGRLWTAIKNVASDLEIDHSEIGALIKAALNDAAAVRNGDAFTMSSLQAKAMEKAIAAQGVQTAEHIIDAAVEQLGRDYDRTDDDGNYIDENGEVHEGTA